jgi:exonuclease VII large subunit
MTRFEFISLAGLAAAGIASSQVRQSQPLIASNPKVEVKGRIQKVQLAQGRGMPYLEVKTGETITQVTLGSMRYLMEQDFNPKAGDEVVVKGYKGQSDVVAISVTLRGEGKVLHLRDENGWPLWQGGRFGRGGRNRD